MTGTVAVVGAGPIGLSWAGCSLGKVRVLLRDRRAQGHRQLASYVLGDN